MTRSHKIGWLVLAAAMLFALWKMPRLHGQGFGSFSHDQPFLAKDATGITQPPLTKLQAWWHWEDVNTLATNWVDRIGGNVISSSAANAGTNDGTGVYYSGTAIGTNGTVDFFRDFDNPPGAGTFIVNRINGFQNGRRYLIDTISRAGAWFILDGIVGWAQNATAYNTLGASSYDEKSTMAFSLVDNFGTAEYYLNDTLLASVGSTYSLAHDENYIGNSMYGTNALNGWIYDILVYTNLSAKWSTSSVPSIANVWGWASNFYSSELGFPPPTSPTNNASFPALVWYSAGDLITNGAVLSLTDRSGNNLPLTNRAATTAWPSKTDNVLNGLPILNFDGTSDYLQNQAVSNAVPNSYAIVLSFTAPNGNRTILSGGQLTTRNQFSYDNDTEHGLVLSGGAAFAVPFSYSSDFKIYMAIFNSTGSSIWANNQFLVTGNAGTNPEHGMTVGTDPSFYAGWWGYYRVAEIIMFDGNLTGTNRTSVYRYLKSKYGL